MSEKILLVDDEPNVLEGYRRVLKHEFHFDTAGSGPQGLAAIESQGPYALIVSDFRMPVMDGVQFLAKVKELEPHSVRIMLTGHADQQTAIDAVNQGNIFRFLTKPCPSEVLANGLRAGIQQYRLVTAEKELLEKTVWGCVQVLTDVLSLVNPAAFSRSSRVRRLVREIADHMKVQEPYQLEIAAMLSQIGCVTLPEETLTKIYQGSSLLPRELQLYLSHPSVGHDLVARIPRLEETAQIIAYQDKLYNGSGRPGDGKRGEEIPLSARILKVALDFDKIVLGGMSADEALEKIAGREGWYDPFVVEALKAVLDRPNIYVVRTVKAADLTEDMLIAEDLYSVRGLLLVSKGHEVTASLRARLKNFAESNVIKNAITVSVPVRQEESDSNSVRPIETDAPI